MSLFPKNKVHFVISDEYNEPYVVFELKKPISKYIKNNTTWGLSRNLHKAVVKVYVYISREKLFPKRLDSDPYDSKEKDEEDGSQTPP